MSLSDNLQPGPDIRFFRNTGIALITLSLVAGSIGVIGSLKAGESPAQISLAR